MIICLDMWYKTFDSKLLREALSFKWDDAFKFTEVNKIRLHKISSILLSA